MAKLSAVDAESGPQRMLRGEFLKYVNLFFISYKWREPLILSVLCGLPSSESCLYSQCLVFHQHGHLGHYLLFPSPNL